MFINILKMLKAPAGPADFPVTTLGHLISSVYLSPIGAKSSQQVS